MREGEMESELRIGEIPYLECIPYFQPVREQYSQPGYRLVPGSPAELGAELRQGRLDAGLTPALEYALAPQDYLLLPGLGLGTRGPMASSLLFSDILLDDLDDSTVSISPTAVTAAAALKIVLGKYLQYSVEFETGWGNAEAYLLIGDAALRERALNRYNYVYDLGELWQYYTHQPLVLALWAVRREAAAAKAELIRLLLRSLGYALESSEQDYPALARRVKGYEWLDPARMVEIWRQIQYHLAPPDLEGLNRFYQDAEEINLIEQVPSLEFFGP